MTDLTDPIFHDEDVARKHFEAIRWPNGPVCPKCGTVDQATLVQGKSHRKGMYQCNACRDPFTVTVGSVMESSHVPLHKWALGFHLMASSKKGVSAHQLMRTLGLGSYRTAWFLAHRIREAMRPEGLAPLGGEGATVEIDETYIGKQEGAPKQRFNGGKFKNTVLPARRPSARIPSARRITRWLTSDPAALASEDRRFTEALCAAAPGLKTAAEHVRAFSELLRQRRPSGLDP